MKAIIPAAGLGTRFLPGTKCTPKELLPVLDKPVIQYVVEEALEPDGVDGVVIVNSRLKPQIESYFSVDDALEEHLRAHGKDCLADKVRAAGELPVSFCYQDEARGLGHAVLCGEPFCRGEYFGVVLPDDVFVGDVPVMSQLIDVHKRLGGTVVALERVPRGDVSRYGIVRSEEVEGGGHRILDMVEKPPVDEAPGEYAIMGRYVLSPSVFPLLAEGRLGAGGEIQLTDALRRLAETEPVWGVVYRGRRFDCGTQKGWLAANVQLALEDPELRKVVLDVVRAFQ